MQLAQQCHDKNYALLWHKRLGHRNNNTVKELQNLAKSIQIGTCNHKEICETCVKLKLTNDPSPKKGEHRAKGIHQLLHTNVYRHQQSEVKPIF